MALGLSRLGAGAFEQVGNTESRGPPVEPGAIQSRTLDAEDRDDVAPLPFRCFAAAAIPLELAQDRVFRGVNEQPGRRFRGDLQRLPHPEPLTIEGVRPDDVFIAVLHEIGDFDPAVVNFRPWLFRRVIRLCRERGMPVSGGVFAGLDAAAREIAALNKMSETEAVRLIEANLAKGPKRGKAANEEDAQEEAA